MARERGALEGAGPRLDHGLVRYMVQESADLQRLGYDQGISGRRAVKGKAGKGNRG
jgi:hypothetical protein